MHMLLKALDWVWSLKALTGVRSLIGKTVIIGLPIYQALATSKELISVGVDLPDLDAKVLAAILAWLGTKLPAFIKEHKPT